MATAGEEDVPPTPRSQTSASGRNGWSFALLVLLGVTVVGASFAPATALLSDQAERAGLEQTLGFVLLNLAWAPGNLIGAVAGGAVAELAGESAPYLILAALSLATLLLLRRLLRMEAQLDAVQFGDS